MGHRTVHGLICSTTGPNPALCDDRFSPLLRGEERERGVFGVCGIEILSDRGLTEMLVAERSGFLRATGQIGGAERVRLTISRCWR